MTRVWYAMAILPALWLAFMVGRWSKKCDTRVETKTVEVVKWQKSEVTAAVRNESAEKRRSVRVVTRTVWMRSDGTPLKTQERVSGTEESRSNTSQTSTAKSSHVQSERSAVRSESVTAAPRFPRLHVGGMLGLDLGAGLERRWGAQVSVRVAGPVWVGAWALPGMKVGGASVGVAF